MMGFLPSSHRARLGVRLGAHARPSRGCRGLHERALAELHRARGDAPAGPAPAVSRRAPPALPGSRPPRGHVPRGDRRGVRRAPGRRAAARRVPRVRGDAALDVRRGDARRRARRNRVGRPERHAGRARRAGRVPRRARRRGATASAARRVSRGLYHELATDVWRADVRNSTLSDSRRRHANGFPTSRWRTTPASRAGLRPTSEWAPAFFALTPRARARPSRARATRAPSSRTTRKAWRRCLLETKAWKNADLKFAWPCEPNPFASRVARALRFSPRRVRRRRRAFGNASASPLRENDAWLSFELASMLTNYPRECGERL